MTDRFQDCGEHPSRPDTAIDRTIRGNADDEGPSVSPLAIVTSSKAIRTYNSMASRNYREQVRAGTRELPANPC